LVDANPISFIGAPMFIVSGTAPLLRNVVSHTNHPTAQDPYFSVRRKATSAVCWRS
jgi:hypothetical protein